MIIVKIYGGLGNQLFQYAIGRNLALKNNTELKLDISFYPKQIKRAYLLSNFNIVENICSQNETKYFKKYTLPWLLNILNRKLLYFKEKQFNFNNDILRLTGSFYLDGYWQSEKYFKNIENTIKKEFTLKNKPTQKTVDWVKKIEESNSISLHIRRGDYVNNPKINQFHGICDINYYNRAIKLISEKVKTPIFFIFSDNIEWTKNNLKIDFPIYFVSDKNTPDYEELIIMSKCKHNIIANSSFSWWGGWLNNNPNKIIIAPQKWFQNTKINTNEILPTTWIKI